MNKSKWYLYIIQCNDGSLYTGITTDVQRRFNEHSGSKLGAKFLRGKSPLTPRYSTSVGNKSDASKLEYRVKKLTRIQKEKLINGTRELPLFEKTIK